MHYTAMQNVRIQSDIFMLNSSCCTLLLLYLEHLIARNIALPNETIFFVSCLVSCACVSESKLTCSQNDLTNTVKAGVIDNSA